MRKLKLDLDTLCVESLATAALEAGNGTVHGLGSRFATCESIVNSCITYCDCTLACAPTDPSSC
ncbi:hypothetical protein [Longimicrobium sp.]|uniref:hypothetical protein n=1 Tax=Longimicrobium sp. TaxID=2029185 RepID=UPI002CB52E37|nr:hypothetical protein [Longimicrobium sp.]HSU14938.1 hypothetical protein [Longimicrobium sp.]